MHFGNWCDIVYHNFGRLEISIPFNHTKSIDIPLIPPNPHFLFQHTLPLLTMTIDFLLWRHSRPTWKSAFIVIYIFMIAYLIEFVFFLSFFIFTF